MSRMTRRRFVQGAARASVLGYAVAMLPGCTPVAWGPHSGRVLRIGYLNNISPGEPDDGLAGLQQRLRELGYRDGNEASFELRYAETQLERLPELAADLVGRDVDVVVAGGAPAALAARDATTTIPVVAVLPLIDDPVRFGLVASLSQPGGNVTGIIGAVPGLWSKRLELLKASVPAAKRIAVVWNTRVITKDVTPADWDRWAAATDVQVVLVDVGGPEDLMSAFKDAAATADALLVPSTAAVTDSPARLADLALRYRLPAMSDYLSAAQAGLMLAYAPDPVDLYRDAAVLVDKVLRGARPADLPIERPTRFHLVVNMTTVQTLGVTISPYVAAQVTEWVQ